MNKLICASLFTDKDSEYYETKGGLIEDFIDIHEVHLMQIAEGDFSNATFIITMPENGKIKIAVRDTQREKEIGIHTKLKITLISDQEILIEEIRE